MQLGEQVRTCRGKYWTHYGSPVLRTELTGVVVGHDLGLNIVRFADGEEWACYDDELEIVSQTQQSCERKKER